MTQKQMPGVMLYFDRLSFLDRLDDVHAGRLFRAVIQYARDGEDPIIEDTMFGVAWDILKPMLDYDAQRYAEVSEKRRLSALRRWEKAHANANASQKQPQTQPQTQTQTKPKPTPTQTQIQTQKHNQNHIHIHPHSQPESGTGLLKVLKTAEAWRHERSCLHWCQDPSTPLRCAQDDRIGDGANSPKTGADV